MRLLAGTSGFAYKEWKGSFYPDDIKSADMLRYYASQFPTVEINNTFYRMPNEQTLRGWAEQVPQGFTFVLKATQRITHQKRLRDADEPLRIMLTVAAALGPALGPFLFQLPPNLKLDLPRLTDFLALLPPTIRAAFEFRHKSWHDDQVFDALRTHNAALCIADTLEDATPFVSTTDWGYLRLRREQYEPGDLAEWAGRIHAQPWTDAYVFFKHEDEGTGPRLARAFIDTFAAGE